MLLIKLSKKFSMYARQNKLYTKTFLQFDKLYTDNLNFHFMLIRVNKPVYS